MSIKDLDDIPSNLSNNEHFQQVIDRVAARRGFLKAGMGLGAAAFLAPMLSACGGSSSGDGTDDGDPVASLLGFSAIGTSTSDAIVVPAGYTATVIARWGDALFADSPAWQPDASNSADDQARQIGDNHDGMHFFAIDGSTSEGLLVMNHEYTNYEYLFGAGYTSNWSLEKARKAQHAHGISVIHLRKDSAGQWQIVLDSSFNRRLHLNSPMQLTGPAAGDALLKTSADDTGTQVLGTANNCANGWTPWGTYLTCEENFNGYFGSVADEANGSDGRSPMQQRYGYAAGGFGYRWHEVDNRFDYSVEPNEGNRFGWIVEIDPFDPTSTPKKRTALGRFKHENAALSIAANGKVVVYMGDDERFDYIYKFVSDGTYVAGDSANNADLLDAGKLYVARFGDGTASGDAAGTGEWILLDKSANATLAADSSFASQAEVLIHARAAADLVGATMMDRPEWIAVHPDSGEVYCTLTNNSRRTGSQVDDANPRASNNWGQIVRWRESGGDATATTFEWDLFLLAGNPIAFPDRSDARSGSSNITADNTFNSPDGLGFDGDGRLWIETDGNFSNTGNYEGQGNNQVLAADPTTGEVRRFLTGPSGCEITGLTFSPDSTAMFVNVQHPGEVGNHPNAPTPPAGTDINDYIAANPLAFSQWPEASGGRPRSATVIITKDDGGVIGS